MKIDIGEFDFLFLVLQFLFGSVVWIGVCQGLCLYCFVLGVDDCCLVQLESLPAMVAGVWSNETNVQLEATTQFRKLLSIGKGHVLILALYLWFHFLL